MNSSDRERARVCVIGGSRYVGRLLVERLRDAGHHVTVINRGSSAPPQGVEHLVADRDDEAALTGALGPRHFDVVVDQVCYTPVQAAVAARVFRGRTRRYVMTSTIEVYDPASAALPPVPPGVPVPEEQVLPADWSVDLELPWHDEAYLEAHYAEGKRQAEAVLTRQDEARGPGDAFAFATVRSAHVLGGGAREFTGRLAHHVQRVARGEPVEVHARTYPTVFVHHEELADLLAWAATDVGFTGPLNAASDGLLDVRDVTAAVGQGLGREPVHRTVAAGEPASPFSCDRHYAMSNARAKSLGFRFSRTAEWLPRVAAEAVA